MNVIKDIKSLLLSIILFLGIYIPIIADQPKVLVTIPVYKKFIEMIAGDKVSVILMVPVGASAHTYEPTPKQVIASSYADIWFTTGEAFEIRALRALQANNPYLKAVDLRQGLDLIQAESCCKGHCHGDAFDPHVWLSPRLASLQVSQIVNVLKEKYPKDADFFEERGRALKDELKALDVELQALLGDGAIKRLVVVAHPAYGYMKRDYGIEQLSIEVEGKDPAPRQLTDLIVRAKAVGIKTIFTEPQYSNKGAKLIAKQLGIPTVDLDPYSENYFEMMRKTGKLFSEAPKIN